MPPCWEEAIESREAVRNNFLTHFSAGFGVQVYECSSSALMQSQYGLARIPAAHCRAEGVLSFHQVEPRDTKELSCTTSQLLLSALNANFCVDIASKHLSTPQVQEGWIFASQKRNLSVTDQAEGNDIIYLTVWIVGKWRHKHWFRPKPNIECKPGPSGAQLTSYFTLPRKQNGN